MTEFRIADTFTDSLARLIGEEQKPVKTTAFDLQIEPASPGLSFNTERILLYVACTRARAFLLVTGVAPASEVLDDLQKAASSNS